MAVRFGQVIIDGDNGDSLASRFDLNASPATGATTIIQDIPRPRRLSLTDWQGANPRRQTLQLFLDGWQGRYSVAHEISALKRLAYPRDSHLAPPRVKWDTGGVLLHDKTHEPHSDWWIEDLAWDMQDALVAHASTAGPRTAVRQRVTVTLVRIVEAPVLRSVAKRQQHSGKAKGHTRRVVVHQGDTLKRIAQRELGNPDRWTEIKALNPTITDPANVTLHTILVPPRNT